MQSEVHHEVQSERVTFSPERRATRPSFLPYRSLLRKHPKHLDRVETEPPDRTTGAIPKQYWQCEASRADTNCLMAPRATPEDSLIGSCSASSEEDRGILCPPPKTVHAEIAMQAKMLCDLEDRRTELLRASKQGGDDRTERGRLRPRPSVYGETIPENGGICLSGDNRGILGKETDESDRVTGLREWHKSSVSVSLTSSATQLVHFDKTCDDVRPKAPCLPHATVRFLMPTDGNESDDSSTTLIAAPPSVETKRRSLSLSLALPPKCVLKHGLSPGSPTYQERHVKFCHVGAHALDVFFSPDDHMPSPFSRSAPCFSRQQDTCHSSYMFPHVGAMTPHEAPSFTTPFEALHGVKDFDDDYEYDDDDYCLISRNYNIPDHLMAAPVGPSLVLNSPERTTDGVTVQCSTLALPVDENGIFTNQVSLSKR